MFEGIISDLFPGTSWPNPDYGALKEALHENCRLRNLQATDWFVKKIIQVRNFSKHFDLYRCLPYGMYIVRVDLLMKLWDCVPFLESF